jgi:hypothetical protein
LLFVKTESIAFQQQRIDQIIYVLSKIEAAVKQLIMPWKNKEREGRRI